MIIAAIHNRTAWQLVLAVRFISGLSLRLSYNFIWTHL